MNLFFRLTFALIIGCWLGACSDNGTDVRSHYEVDLSRIDAQIQLDSARFDYFLNGDQQASWLYTDSSLKDHQVSLPAMPVVDGDSVKLVYSVWASGLQVATGVDSFVVGGTASGASTAALDLKPAAIDAILATLSSSGSSSSNGSSSSQSLPDTAKCGTASGFSIGFLTDKTTLSEGVDTLYLLLGGLSGTTLSQPVQVQLQLLAGSDDIVLPSSGAITIPAKTAPCSRLPVLVDVKQDMLVEGPEDANLLIGNLGGLNAGEIQTLYASIADGDSAYVSLGALPDSVYEGTGDSIFDLPLVLHTNGAKLAKSIEVMATVVGGSAKPDVDYTLVGNATFAAEASDNTIQNVKLTIEADTLWEPLDSLIFRVEATSSWAGASADMKQTLLVDNDYEYLLLPTNGNSIALFDPTGKFLQTLTQSLMKNEALLANLAKDTFALATNGKLYAMYLRKDGSGKAVWTAGPSEVLDYGPVRICSGPFAADDGLQVFSWNNANKMSRFRWQNAAWKGLDSPVLDLSDQSPLASGFANIPGTWNFILAGSDGEAHMTYNKLSNTFDVTALGSTALTGVAVAGNGAVARAFASSVSIDGNTVPGMPSGVAPKGLIATTRNTFWLITSDGLIEFDANGPLVTLATAFSPNTFTQGGIYIKSSVRF